MNTSGAFSKPS
ncbi:hypothetical protein AWZ03_014992, partial [Drosophila navojoa]